MDQGKLYKTQISFTEWFEAINHKNLKEMRDEDYKKRIRLAELKKYINLPFDKPTSFRAIELKERSSNLLRYIQTNGQELCALRLNPKTNEIKKHRIRGLTVKGAMQWFDDLNLDPTNYDADFVPHIEATIWSTIFIINRHGIFGEIIPGNHYQLTQGFYKDQQPIIFSYDFNEWNLSENNEIALNHCKEIVLKLNIKKETQEQLRTTFQSTFTNNYLNGYFETVFSEEKGLWFVDYNRILGELYKDFKFTKTENTTELSGNIASKGTATGKVRIITDNLEDFQEGEILVTKMTTPNFVPIMQKAAAIITDLGGILSHAAIISRELGIPCITGTKIATTDLKTGDLVEVDATKGIIRNLPQAL